MYMYIYIYVYVYIYIHIHIIEYYSGIVQSNGVYEPTNKTNATVCLSLLNVTMKPA